ncbi:MAG: polysaccharide deacetylase family protein [Deferribacterales bacterium]
MVCFQVSVGYSDVINQLPTNDKVIALTFDGCETKTPSYFDKKILDYIFEHKLPVTIFLNGKFIERNHAEILRIANLPFISLQNHSYAHVLHMENMKEEALIEDIEKTSNLLKNITNKKPIFFRFPGGNYDNKTLKLVESLGYKVVHWSFESGDPDKNMSGEKIFNKVKLNVKPGSILIFHINGRGWHAKDALPKIVEYLKNDSYNFVMLEEILK